MDERKGRRAAHAQGLGVFGTLGILAIASKEGLIDFDDAIARLALTNFHITPELIAAIRDRVSKE